MSKVRISGTGLPERLRELYGLWLEQVSDMSDTQSTLPGVAQIPPDACIYYEQCGNQMPHNNSICDECLDRVREAGHGRGDST